MARPDLARQVMDKARREGVLSSVEAAFNRLDQPLPLGYSSAGVIELVGEGLQGLKVGDRVACAGGGYAVHAEYALVPHNLLAHLPDQVDFESAAFDHSATSPYFCSAKMEQSNNRKLNNRDCGQLLYCSILK